MITDKLRVYEHTFRSSTNVQFSKLSCLKVLSATTSYRCKVSLNYEKIFYSYKIDEHINLYSMISFINDELMINNKFMIINFYTYVDYG